MSRTQALCAPSGRIQRMIGCGTMRLFRNISIFLVSCFLLATSPGQSADPVFRITPLRPVAELQREALAAKPPQESGDFRQPDLVEVITLDPAIKLELRYA